MLRTLIITTAVLVPLFVGWVSWMLQPEPKTLRQWRDRQEQ